MEHIDNKEEIMVPTRFPALDRSAGSSSSELSEPIYTPWQRAVQLLGTFVDAATPTYFLYTVVSPQSLYPEAVHWIITANTFTAAHILEKGMNALCTTPIIEEVDDLDIKENLLTSLLEAVGDNDKKLGIGKIAFDSTVSFALAGSAGYGFWQINHSSLPEASIVPILGAGGLGVYIIVSFCSKQGIKWCHHKHEIPGYEEEYIRDPKYNFLQISGQTIICVALDLTAMMTILKCMANGGELTTNLNVQFFIMLTAHISRQLLSLSNIPDLSEYFAKEVTRKDESDFSVWLSASQRLGATPATLQVVAGAGLRGFISLIVCSSIYLGMESWCWGTGGCKDASALENLPVLGTVLTIGLAGKAVYDHGKAIGEGIGKCWSSLFHKQQSRYERIPDAPQQITTPGHP